MDLTEEDAILDAEERVADRQQCAYERARHRVLARARAKEPEQRSVWECFELRADETRDDDSGGGMPGVTLDVMEVEMASGDMNAVLRRARRDVERHIDRPRRAPARMPARRSVCEVRRGRQRQRAGRRRASRAGPSSDDGPAGSDDDRDRPRTATLWELAS